MFSAPHGTKQRNKKQKRKHLPSDTQKDQASKLSFTDPITTTEKMLLKILFPGDDRTLTVPPPGNYDEQLYSFLGAIAIAAGLFKVGYELRKLRDPAISIADSLKSIDGTLKEISRTIKHIATQIDYIIEQILLLVEKIRGVVEDIAIKKSIAGIRSAYDSIRTYTKSEIGLKLAIDNGEYGAMLNQIKQGVYEITDIKGTSGVLLSAPGMAMWAQAFTIQQKHYAVNNDDYEPLPVYDEEFHKSNFHDLKTFFQTVESLQEEIQKRKDDARYLKEELFYKLDRSYLNLIPTNDLDPNTSYYGTTAVFVVKWQKTLEPLLFVQLYKRTKEEQQQRKPWRFHSEKETPYASKNNDCWKGKHKPFMKSVATNLDLIRQVKAHKKEILKHENDPNEFHDFTYQQVDYSQQKNKGPSPSSSS